MLAKRKWPKVGYCILEMNDWLTGSEWQQLNYQRKGMKGRVERSGGPSSGMRCTDGWSGNHGLMSGFEKILYLAHTSVPPQLGTWHPFHLRPFAPLVWTLCPPPPRVSEGAWVGPPSLDEIPSIGRRRKRDQLAVKDQKRLRIPSPYGKGSERGGREEVERQGHGQ